MSWLHPAILYGLALAAIPVILHLLLRQKPKQLLFPALRLIQQRQRQNVRRMRIRHLLLLLLRVAVIAALVLAMARPSVPAANYSLSLREILTLLAIVGLAIGAYYGMAARWRASALPSHELTSRKLRLRTGSIVAAVLLTLLAVVWPYQRRIAADLKSPRPASDITLPVAAVFLFDTSLSMGYQQAGKTRLDVAREIALAHLSDLPTGSRAAIGDVGSDHPLLFQSTLSGAESQLKSRELRPLRLPLNDRIRAALRLQEDDRQRTLSEQGALPDDQRTDRFLRRIYVFTDLAASAWRLGGTSRLAADLERLQAVNVFLIDVGEINPPNTALTDAKAVRPRVTIGGHVAVTAELLRTGEAANDIAVELLLDDGTDRLIKFDQQAAAVADGIPQRVEFKPQPITSGPIVHGEVRLISSDPLPFDDVRYFTVATRPPIRVLTISPTDDEALEWNTALEVAGYQTAVHRPGDLSRLSLVEYDVICLINVPQLESRYWNELGQYVSRGGGLAVILGSHTIEASNYRAEEPQAFLPGAPDVHTAPGVKFLRVTSPDHPIMRGLANEDLIGLLESADVERFWRVHPSDSAAVLAEYTDAEHTPALLERTHGRGRVLMFTTAVDIKDAWWSQWNILPNPSGPVFTFLAFVDEIARRLAQDSDVQLTYAVGEQPVLKLDVADEERTFLLQQPGFRQSRLTLPAGETLLTVPDVSELGHYDLKRSDGSPASVSGFSVNPPRGESDLTRITSEDLDHILGEQRYQVARSIGELQEQINMADLGKELFPWILAAVVLIFVAEHFMANWFYDDEPGTAPGPATWVAPPLEPASRSLAATT
ncbi:MAG: BatA domain-containing protein [Planctomycetaceae bacterium]|nr:BatA domain-containing protein [Planctomycetaceae bacterium]